MKLVIGGAVAAALLGTGAFATHAAIPNTVTANFALTSSGSILSGDVGGVWSGNDIPSNADIAMVLGPTGIATPSDSYLQTAYNLYMEPSGLYQGTESEVFAVTTPEASGSTSVGLGNDEQALMAALLPALQNGDHVTLFGYSQSTAAISEVLNQLTSEYGSQYAGDVNFVMVGDSGSPYGIMNNLYGSLPSWAQGIFNQNADAWGLGGGVMNTGDGVPMNITPDGLYHGDVFTLSSGGSGLPFQDGYADWSPNSFTNGSWFTQLMGLFTTHEMYMGVSPDDVTSALSQSNPSDVVNYLSMAPTENPLELLTNALVDVGWLPQSFGDMLTSIGL